MNKTALITGATGFIGGVLARSLLENGWSVSLILREGSDTSSIQDIIDESTVYLYDGLGETLVEVMTKVKPDVVFHLASLVLVQHKTEDIPCLISSNILLGAQLLDAMVKASVENIVVASTLWQFSGKDERQAVNLYAATKQSFESIVDYYHDAFGISAMSLVLADTYGVGDIRPKLINFLIKSLGDSAELSMSPGDQIIDISHVKDVAKSFELAGIKLYESSEPVRLSRAVCGTRLTVKQLVATVEKIGDGKINAVFGGRPYRPREILRPAKLLEFESDWKKIGLDEGIRELIKASLQANL